MPLSCVSVRAPLQWLPTCFYMLVFLLVHLLLLYDQALGSCMWLHIERKNIKAITYREQGVSNHLHLKGVSNQYLTCQLQILITMIKQEKLHYRRWYQPLSFDSSTTSKVKSPHKSLHINCQPNLWSTNPVNTADGIMCPVPWDSCFLQKGKPGPPMDAPAKQGCLAPTELTGMMNNQLCVASHIPRC